MTDEKFVERLTDAINERAGDGFTGAVGIWHVREALATVREDAAVSDPEHLHAKNETLKAERDLLSRALDAAVRRVASAIDDCACESCETEREQMRDYFIKEARDA